MVANMIDKIPRMSANYKESECICPYVYCYKTDIFGNWLAVEFAFAFLFCFVEFFVELVEFGRRVIVG